jgi:hypothetical protein
MHLLAINLVLTKNTGDTAPVELSVLLTAHLALRTSDERACLAPRCITEPCLREPFLSELASRSVLPEVLLTLLSSGHGLVGALPGGSLA